MKKILTILILILSLFGFAQKQGNVWYFGPNGAGIDFNSCQPVVLTNGWNNTNSGLYEGSTTICDTNGQMLFYSNGTSVFNANNVYMQNGSAVLGGSTNTMTQNIIIPKPGSTSLYYLFSPEIQAFSGPGSIMYSIIDMTLASGLGAVTSYGNILRDTIGRRSSEKLTAVKNANGQDIWLIGHDYYSNKFFSYLITSSGINPVPVESSVGPIITDPLNQSHFPAIGELKASPDGSKLGFTAMQSGITAVFNFNTSTGVVSNPISISIENGGIGASGYGVSFSPDNLKFYLSSLTQINTSGQFETYLYQFNLSVWDSLSIQNSRNVIYNDATASRFYSLKLGPNKKIYVAKSTGALYLGIINSPDQIGAACNFVDQGIYLNGLQATWGLNNCMEMFSNYPLSITTTSVNSLCNNQCTGTATANPCGGLPPYSYLWNTLPVQTTQTAIGLCEGNYTVTVSDAASAIVTYSLTIVAVNSFPTVSISGSISICPGSSTILSAAGGMNYLWSSGAVTSGITVSPLISTNYSLTVANGACIKDTNVIVNVYNGTGVVGISGNNSLCSGDSTLLHASGQTDYLWSTGATSSSIIVKPTVNTLYKVTVTNSSVCSNSSNILVSVTTTPKATIINPQTICAGSRVELIASGGANYLWSTGETIFEIQVNPNTTTSYSVIVSNGNCSNTANTFVLVNPLPEGTACCDATIIPGQNAVFNIIPVNSGYIYNWIPKEGLSCDTCPNPVASPIITTVYNLTITNNVGCQIRDALKVTINCEELFVPNAFSPNADGKNDVLFVSGYCVQSLEFKIYDRWGNNVFESNNMNDGWDGKYKGRDCDPDVFVYSLKAILNNGMIINRKGNISLIK